MATATNRTRRAAAILVGASLVTLAACSSSAKPAATGSATTIGGTGTSDTCKALNDFKESLSTLRSKVTASGVSGDISGTFDAAQADIDKLRSDVKAADRPKVDDLRDAVDNLRNAYENHDGIPAIIDAAQNVGAAAENLSSAISQGCPSG